MNNQDLMQGQTRDQLTDASAGCAATFGCRLPTSRVTRLLNSAYSPAKHSHLILVGKRFGHNVQLHWVCTLEFSEKGFQQDVPAFPCLPLEDRYEHCTQPTEALFPLESESSSVQDDHCAGYKLHGSTGINIATKPTRIHP